MYISASLLIAALAGIAHAETPAGFTPQVNTKLDVMFNSTMVNTGGEQLAKNAVATQPKLALPSGMVSKSETYMFVMLDLDIPPANGSTKRRTLLHCMNTGFKTTGQQLSGAATLLATSEQGPAQYIPPGPPPTDTIAHRYVQLLFQQPAGLSISAADFADTNNRFNFDVPSFMSKNGVSAPVAANFFKVDGRASASATGAATGTGAMPSSTLTTFQGTAGQMDLPYGLAGLLGGMALFAM